MDEEQKLYGIYRGTVVNNVDPLMLGRLQVSVPSVLGDNSMNWASPCVPFAGRQKGMFLIPDVGANVFVIFEGGQPDYPVWVGCFWGTGDVPAQAGMPHIKMIKTDTVTITIDDLLSNTIKIETVSGAKVSLTPQGISIENGAGSKIEMTGPQVNVNNGGLEVQ